jgi:putative ABC transport system substrate-binding protein
MVHLPQAAKAQQGGKTYRVGVLTPAAVQWQATVFGSAMRQLGYEEGVNLTLVVRDADNRLDTLRRLADELVRENVDVIVAINMPGARAAIDATKVIPIVMSVVADPVSTGLVTSFARPGGNATGASTLGRDLTGKRLELLKEAVPAADRIAVLLNPRDPIVKPQIDDVRRAAAGLGVEAELFPVHGPDDIDRAFTDLTRWSAQAILRLAGQALPVSGETIERAHRHRLPTMLLTKEEVHAGALMSYDADRAEIFRRTAHFVDKILRSEKPGNLPIEQPTVFKLVINLKTARAIGLTIPPAVLARADELIE